MEKRKIFTFNIMDEMLVDCRGGRVTFLKAAGPSKLSPESQCVTEPKAIASISLSLHLKSEGSVLSSDPDKGLSLSPCGLGWDRGPQPLPSSASLTR